MSKVSITLRLARSPTRTSNNNSSTTDRLLKVVHQLHDVAIACLFVASKVEDERPLDLEDAVMLADTKSVPTDILHWEVVILETLDFRANTPTTLDFVAFFIQAFDTSNLIVED
eukprot:Platyproteum_vivax@DN12877_c0_g1_i1.p1